MDIANKMYDKDFRQKLIADPKKYYQEFNNNSLDSVEIVAKKNTRKTTYIVIPSGNITEDMGTIQAAGVSSAGSVSTASSFSSLGTVTSTISSATTGASVGTAGTGASDD